MPAFAPSLEWFLLFLSARQEHHPIASQLKGDRFWQWKPNPTAVLNTHLHLCSGPCPAAGSGDWTEAFLRLSWASRASSSSHIPTRPPSCESSSSPQSFPLTPPRRSYAHACNERVCVQRNPSALCSPIPVCFPHAKSSIPLGFFFLVCWLRGGRSPALWGALCAFTVVISLFCTVPCPWHIKLPMEKMYTLSARLLFLRGRKS